VFTHLELEDYYARKSDGGFNKTEFYSSPELYQSTFSKYLTHADMYIPCHYWSDKADFIFTRNDLKNENVKLSVVADISCDIDGPVASTLRPSKIADPIYGYNPKTESEDDFMKEGVIAVMAVDNLPCELPLDASVDFGNELLKEVFPLMLLEDKDGIIARGSETTLSGELSEYFSYLDQYILGKE
ncbi:MAG: alanine dehydrogenase, partial [Flavobacteriales bacterium]